MGWVLVILLYCIIWLIRQMGNCAVVLAPAGKRLFANSVLTMNNLAKLFSESDFKQLDKLTAILNKLK